MSRIVIWLAAYGLALLSATFAARYGFKEADTVIDAWLRGGALFGIAIVAVHSIAWGVRLWHQGHKIVAPLVAIAGFVCFCVTLAGGVGTLAGSKDKLATERAKAAVQTKGTSSDTQRVEDELARLPTSRPATSINPLLDISRSNPRFKASNGCDPVAITRPDTRQHCEEFRRLEAELGTAKRREELEADLKNLRKAVVSEERVETVDPQATWLARLLRINRDDAQAYYALGVSFSLELAAMIAVLMNEVMSLRHEAERKLKAAAIASAEAPAPVPSAPIDASFVDISPARALPPPESSVVVQMPQRVEGQVSKFVAECLQPEDGASATLPEIYESYKSWCARHGWAPYGPKRFELNFAELCKLAEIDIEGAGEDLLARDLRFIA